MEPSLYENKAGLPGTRLEISAPIRPLLTETAKWANFLSIMGYIGVAFMVIAAILLMFAGQLLPTKAGISGFAIGIVYLIMAVIYTFPVYYLSKFASNCRAALQNDDQSSLVRSFDFLKSHYKFLGIVSIIIIVLYLLLIVVAIVSGFAFAHSGH